MKLQILMGEILVSGIVLALLSGCSNAGLPNVKGDPIPYLSWLEGDFQTGFEPDRSLASSKLGSWEMTPPSVDEKDKFLDYVALLDAAGRAAQAEKNLSLFIARYPEDTRGQFVMAVHQLRLKKREFAKFLFNQLEKEADFPWKSLVYNNLGMLALAEDSTQLAVEYFNKATVHGPPIAAPFVNLGALYLRNRNYVDAEALFRKATKIDRGFEDAVLGLGASLEGQGKFKEAHDVYSNYRSSHPKALSVVYNDAIVLGNRLGEKTEAAKLMVKYLEAGGKETARAQTILGNWK